MIPREDLILDVDEYSQQFKKAYNNAYQLALKVTYFTPVTIVPLLSMAARNTKKVALEASYLTKETATEIILKANAQAVNIAKAVGRAQAKI